MSAIPAHSTPDAPVQVRHPSQQAAPLIIASPHSGRNYPDSFVSTSRLDPVALRRSEDYCVDQLFAAAPQLGIPLVAALFPRAFCDVNREPYELDPQMFEERLPSFVNTRSVRVACGLGTIARVVSDGAEIYDRRLSFAEAEWRVEHFYRPYHTALQRLVANTKDRFGAALLLDCHSMPSVGGPMDADAGLSRKDVVLGDRYGTSAHPEVVDFLDQALQGLGLAVARNAPYAGGHTTQIYGRPAKRLHAIQIEINRALYMDEARLELGAGFTSLNARIADLMRALAEVLRPGGRLSERL